ncbi:MAG TPA: lipocalin-like domain-containing protein, partial [Xanthobacteraceae bacterium]|nr:lipocalin-like domain-containing protein [Xanthobacteraceae bacterium]
TYTREGRMFVVIVRGERPKPESVAKMSDQQRADLFRSMTAYTGKFKFDEKVIEHDIDISWNEVWTGTKQIRYARREGNRIILTTPQQPRPIDGKVSETTLVWEKVN